MEKKRTNLPRRQVRQAGGGLLRVAVLDDTNP